MVLGWRTGQGKGSYAAVRIGLWRIDQTEVNVLPGFELEPGWFVEVKGHDAVPACFFSLQPRFVFCGNHVVIVGKCGKLQAFGGHSRAGKQLNDTSSVSPMVISNRFAKILIVKE